MHGHGEPEPAADVGPVGGLPPGRVVATLPADRPLPLEHGLLQAARRDDRHGPGSRVPLAELGRDVDRVADLGPVASPELDRIHPDRGGDVLHVGLEREQRLGCSVAAVCARHRDVRVGDLAVEALERAVVGAEATHAGHHLDGQPVGAVGAGVRDDPHLLRRELAIRVDAGLEGDRLGMPGPRGHELLLAGELQPHGAARRHREVRHDVLDQHLLLRAEAPADPWLDDPDLLHGQPDERREHAPDVERHLGRRDDLQPVVAVPSRDGDVRLDRRLLHLVHPERLLEDAVGRREPRFDVPGLGLDVVDDVVARVVGALHVRLVVDHRGAVDDRVVLVEDGGEHLVGHVDQVDGGLRDLLRVRRDRRDAVPDVAHLVVEAHLVVGQRVRVALAAGRVANPRHVAVVKHGAHPGERPGRGIVDRHDPGVGVRAVQHLGDQGPRQVPVIRERGVPLRQLDGVGLRLGVAHHARHRHVLAEDHPRRDR